MTNRILAAVEGAYRRPPLSWTVQAMEWLTEQVQRPLRPLLRRSAHRRAARLTELAAALSTARCDREATEIAAVAARWRRIAEGLGGR